MPGYTDSSPTREAPLPSATTKALRLARRIGEHSAWVQRVFILNRLPATSALGAQLLQRFVPMSQPNLWSARLISRFTLGSLQPAAGAAQMTLISRLQDHYEQVEDPPRRDRIKQRQPVSVARRPEIAPQERPAADAIPTLPDHPALGDIDPSEWEIPARPAPLIERLVSRQRDLPLLSATRSVHRQTEATAVPVEQRQVVGRTAQRAHSSESHPLPPVPPLWDALGTPLQRMGISSEGLDVITGPTFTDPAPPALDRPLVQLLRTPAEPGGWEQRTPQDIAGPRLSPNTTIGRPDSQPGRTPIPPVAQRSIDSGSLRPANEDVRPSDTLFSSISEQSGSTALKYQPHTEQPAGYAPRAYLPLATTLISRYSADPQGRNVMDRPVSGDVAQIADGALSIAPLPLIARMPLSQDFVPSSSASAPSAASSDVTGTLRLQRVPAEESHPWLALQARSTRRAAAGAAAGGGDDQSGADGAERAEGGSGWRGRAESSAWNGSRGGAAGQRGAADPAAGAAAGGDHSQPGADGTQRG
ncbi:MAG: hypothetical protein KatS3mg057_2089 [Herpetosiphonaceae bacterium]|nr:MAG: hypothetical protein KatS3mg057_2089 [Herpetosiphonaceae bacterium]